VVLDHLQRRHLEVIVHVQTNIEWTQIERIAKSLERIADALERANVEET
jgi:uncharacterized protein Yka (UPF0111/DUF47 family)